MNLTTLRYFVAVAEFGSISKAAQKLYITQPALTRHIQRLETELGVALLDRKNECGLTETGKICLEHAKSMLYQAEQLFTSVNAIQKGETGSLAIGYCGGERHFLFFFIKEIRKRYPNIDITFQKNVDTKLLAKKMAEQKLDFVFGGADCVHPDFSFIPIQKSHMQLMVSQDHPLAYRGTIRLEELRESEFVMWKRELVPSFYDSFVSLCGKSGFEPNISKYEHVDSESFFSSILASNSVGVVVSGMQIMADKKLFAFLDILPENHMQIPEEPRVLSWNRFAKNPCVELIVQTVLPDYVDGLGAWE